MCSRSAAHLRKPCTLSSNWKIAPGNVDRLFRVSNPYLRSSCTYRQSVAKLPQCLALEAVLRSVSFQGGWEEVMTQSTLYLT